MIAKCIELFLLWLTFLHEIDSKLLPQQDLCDLRDPQIITFYRNVFRKSINVLVAKIGDESRSDPNRIDRFTNFFLKDIIYDPVTVVDINLKMLPSEYEIFEVIEWSYVLILINDAGYFKKFLKTKPLRPRLRYVIIITKNQHCELVVAEMTEILMELWKSHNIVNAFAHAPCACNQNIYFYMPFEKEKENRQFGLIKIASIEKMLNKNHVDLGNVNPIKNMNGWPLKVSIFKREPSLMVDINEETKINDSCFKCGIDAQILGTLAKHLNFNLTIDPFSQADFGNVYKTGKITGAMRKLVRAEVDIAGNARFIDHPNLVSYTYPFHNEQMCIIVPKAPKKPQWMSIFNCFKMSALCFIIFTEILCSLFWFFKMKQRFSWIEMFAISRSIPTNIKHFKFRGLLGIYIAYCMIINNIFQSSLVKSFGTVQESYDMKTLEEFTQTSYTIHTSYVNIFRNVDTDTFKKLQMKIVDTSTSNEWALYRVAEERSFACLERRSDSKYFIATRFLDRSGYPKLHVIDECPGNYLLAFALQLKSPYLKEFNNVLKRLMEGGFIKKWHAAPAESVLAIKTIQKERNVYKPLSATDIQITFFILIAGYLAGVVTLTVELICCNIIKKKD